MKMKILGALAIAAAFSVGVAQAQVGHDLKDAGHDTAHATKVATHKTVHVTKHVYHKTTRGTRNVGRRTEGKKPLPNTGH